MNRVPAGAARTRPGPPLTGARGVSGSRSSYTPSAISMVMVSQSPSWASFESFAT